MANIDLTEQMDDNQHQGEIIADSEAHDNTGVKQAVPAWIISVVVHVVMLGMLSLIVYAAKEEIEEPAIRTATLPTPPKAEEKKIVVDVQSKEVSLDVPVDADKPSPESTLDVLVEELSSEDDTPADVAKGRDEAVSDKEMGNEGLCMAIGPGSNAAGLFGSRIGGGKKRALGKFGGTRGSESAVDVALRWFKKHQSPNGQWDIDGYPANCTEGLKCEPGTEHTGEDGDVAGTGYAVLCFLGAGFDHRLPSKYKVTVKRGLDWLVSVQKADGSFGRNYEQGIAAMALAEAYAMSTDPALKGPAQKAIDIILARQCADKTGGYGLGWDYQNPNPARIDSSVSGWCTMALKSAAAAGLNIGNGMEGAKQYLEKAWKDCNKDFKAVDPYTDISTFPYTWNAEAGTADGHKNMAPVGALLAVFLGHKAADPMLNSLANFIMKNQFPTAYPCNTYYMYYNTLAIFQIADERWQKWNNTVRDMLVGAQRKDENCFAGSWDFQGTQFPGHQTGRILSTAYCCLSLEVYYRYLPVGALKH